MIWQVDAIYLSICTATYTAYTCMLNIPDNKRPRDTQTYVTDVEQKDLTINNFHTYKFQLRTNFIGIYTKVVWQQQGTCPRDASLKPNGVHDGLTGIIDVLGDHLLER